MLRQIDGIVPLEWASDHQVRLFRSQTETVFSMLGDLRMKHAFEVQRESATMRDRYGRTKFGQSLLLARRLVESGVSLVTVNWDDGTQMNKVSPFWDTHTHNFPTLKERLGSAVRSWLRDIDRGSRPAGLLDTTLVVVAGEFGRTPKIGQVVQNGMTAKTGRDHWPHAFTALLAGGGVARRPGVRGHEPDRRSLSKTTLFRPRISRPRSCTTWASIRTNNIGTHFSR